jgi:RNA polymerase sigma-70 factor (sigma-E family)
MTTSSDADYLAYVQGRMSVLRRRAYGMCGDWHQADDLVQETLTRVYSRWRKVSGADSIDGYVHTIMVRTFLDERRRGWWKVRLLGRPADDRPADDENLDDRAVLRTALTKLPPRQQAVLILRFLCDQSVTDVAHQLGCAEGTVKSQTRHGLNSLRKILGDRRPSMLTGGQS